MKKIKSGFLIAGLIALSISTICLAACFYESYVVREFEDTGCLLVTQVQGGGTLGSAEQSKWTYPVETGCRYKNNSNTDCTVSVKRPDGSIRVQECTWTKYDVNYCTDSQFIAVSNVIERIEPFGIAQTRACE